MGIDLERILRISPVRKHVGSPDMSRESARKEGFNKRFDSGLPKMQEVAGVIEREPVLDIGPAQTAGLRLLFEDFVGKTI
jgi:hypothetical protein